MKDFKWTQIHKSDEGDLITETALVPGGSLYRTVLYGPQDSYPPVSVSMVFVPKKEKN